VGRGGFGRIVSRPQQRSRSHPTTEVFVTDKASADAARNARYEQNVQALIASSFPRPRPGQGSLDQPGLPPSITCETAGAAVRSSIADVRARRQGGEAARTTDSPKGIPYKPNQCCHSAETDRGGPSQHEKRFHSEVERRNDAADGGDAGLIGDRAESEDTNDDERHR
jgi:hypothetical protein